MAQSISMAILTNPLFIIVMILIILLIVLAIFRYFSPQFSIGVEGGAHIGSLKGAFELEAFEGDDDEPNEDDIDHFANEDGSDGGDAGDAGDSDEVDHFANENESDTGDSVASDSDASDAGSDSDDHFENFANPGEKGDFVLFYAHWCGHCKNLMPHFDKLMEKYDGNVRIVKIDSDQNPELMNAHKVKGFPTIRYFPDGVDKINNFKEYPGDRTYSGLMNYLSNV